MKYLCRLRLPSRSGIAFLIVWSVLFLIVSPQTRDNAEGAKLSRLAKGDGPQPAAGRSEPKPQVIRGTMPLDPLAPEERAEAIRVASEDSRVKEALGRGRSRPIYTEFFPVKPDISTGAVDAPVGRHAEVVFYRYDDDKGIRAVVDLRQGTVKEVSVQDGTSVPLAPDEVVEAFNLALRNEQVVKELGPTASTFRVTGTRPTTELTQNRVDGLRLVAPSPDDACYKQRCVSLLFRQGRSYVAGLSVIVNLTKQTVMVERKLR